MSFVTRPAPARVLESARWTGSTTVELEAGADLVLVEGETVCLFAQRPPGSRGTGDATWGTAIAPNLIRVDHSWGAPGRRCWVRRSS